MKFLQKSYWRIFCFEVFTVQHTVSSILCSNLEQSSPKELHVIVSYLIDYEYRIDREMSSVLVLIEGKISVYTS